MSDKTDEEQKKEIYTPSESDFVGDHYVFVRTMLELHKYVKDATDKRFFLEAIGVIFMRLADEIETCVDELAKYTNINYNQKTMVGILLKILLDNDIIDNEIFTETRKFLNIRNDIVHKRWDGTIKEFREVCRRGMILESFFGGLTYDFYDFRGDEILGDAKTWLVYDRDEEKFKSIEYKKNIELHKKLEKMVENKKL